jgi:hypothetical protein
VRRVAAYRNGAGEHHSWEDPLTGALVLTLIDWKVESELRPTFGDGSDCSDLMDIALTRIKALCSGEVAPATVVAEIEGGGSDG